MLVGAPAYQVLAQQNNAVSRKTKNTENKADSQTKVEKAACAEFGVAEVIELLKKYDVDKIEVDFSYQIDYQNNQSVNFQIVQADGNKSFIDILRHNVSCDVSSKNKESNGALSEHKEEFVKSVIIPLPIVSVFNSFKVNRQEFVFNSTHTYTNEKPAKFLVDFYHAALEQAHKIEIESPNLAEKNKLQSFIFSNTTFSASGNQVLIVTRLPRGSLDALLANK